MENAKTMSPELQQSLLDKFESRANEQGFKGKKRKDAQREFLIGAISALDTLHGDPERSCISPSWFFQMLRGEYVQAIRPHVTVQL